MENSKNKGGRRAKYPYAFKQAVAIAFFEHKEPVSSIRERFNLPTEKSVTLMSKRFVQKEGLEMLPETPASGQKEEVALLIKKLEKAEALLNSERLKVVALQTMIEIAEQELAIEIRKK
jgi:hypothetical protein